MNEKPHSDVPGDLPSTKVEEVSALAKLEARLLRDYFLEDGSINHETFPGMGMLAPYGEYVLQHDWIKGLLAKPEKHGLNAKTAAKIAEHKDAIVEAAGTAYRMAMGGQKAYPDFEPADLLPPIAARTMGDVRARLDVFGVLLRMEVEKIPNLPRQTANAVLRTFPAHRAVLLEETRLVAKMTADELFMPPKERVLAKARSYSEKIASEKGSDRQID